MNYLDQGYGLTSEYGMSVDEIIADFKAEMSPKSDRTPRPTESRPSERPAQTTKTRGEHLSMPFLRSDQQKDRPVTGPKRTSETKKSFDRIDEKSAKRDTRVTKQTSDVHTDPMPSAGRHAAGSPAVSDRAGKPAEDHFSSGSSSLSSSFPERKTEAGQRHAPASGTAFRPERRSARPSDAEVQEFIDAFRRGDYLDLKQQPSSNPPAEPDERFYMGGKTPKVVQYAGVEVDISADQNYRSPATPAGGTEDDEEENDTPAGLLGAAGKKLTDALGIRRRSVQPKARSSRIEKPDEEDAAPPDLPVFPEEEAFSSDPSAHRDDLAETPVSTSPASVVSDEERYESSFSDYPTDEYGIKREFSEKDYDELYDEAADPGSFREFVFARLTALLYSFRKAGRTGSRTMEDEQEDLGREVSCAKASKYYGSHIRSMRSRLQLCGILLFLLFWISIGLPVPGMLKTSVVANAVCAGLQLGIMLLCLDVVTTGVMNAVRGKFGADSMAVLACVATLLDAALVSKAGVGSTHLALCLISSLSLTGEMFAALLHARAMRKSLRVPAIGKMSFAVTAETDSATGDVTVLKSVRPPVGFVRRSEQSSPDEDLFRKVSLPLLVIAFVFTMLIALLKKDFADFFYIFSAVFCPAVPFAAMCCCSLPFFLGSMRIFPSGAAVAGWSGMSDIGQSKNLIVTDRDLFPDGTVDVDTIRISADVNPADIISYTGSMMAAAGSCSAPPFAAQMQKTGCRMRNIQSFEYLAGGGMKGVIDGKIVLCGSTDLMRLMNVRIPYRLVDKTSVLLSVDGVLCGIFNMKYTAKPQVREALVDLMRSNRHPVFAIRDFNVTPEMLHAAFDVATDGYDFPPYVERFEMSSAESTEDCQIAAVICREGLGPLVHAADTARSMYTATRINTVLAVLSAFLGVFAAAVKLLSSGVLPIGFLLGFMLFWTLVSLLVSFFTRM